MTKKETRRYLVEIAIGWGESVMVGPFKTEEEAKEYASKHGSQTIHWLYPPKDKS